MKTTTLVTALMLIASLGHAQTRLETEFQSLEQAAIAADKKKVEDEQARQAAEAARERQEAQEKSKQILAGEVEPLNAALAAKFNRQKVASIHTPMRTLPVGLSATTLDYVLIMTKFDNGMICQIASFDESYDSRIYSDHVLNRFAFCVSSEGTYSFYFLKNDKKVEAVQITEPVQSSLFKKNWNIFSYLRQLDIEQDKAKSAGYSRLAAITCLESSLSLQEQLYQNTDSYQHDSEWSSRYSYSYEAPKSIYAVQREALQKAKKSGASLDEVGAFAPACLRTIQSR